VVRREVPAVIATMNRSSTNRYRQVALAGTLVLVSLALSAILSGAAGGQVVRVCIAALITMLLGIMAVANPAWGSALTLLFLVQLGLLRRLLIPLIGWSSYDPLLVVGPIVAIVLVGRMILVPRRPLAEGWVSKAILGLVALSVLEAFNPKGGGPISGLVGLLFLAAPLLWFFVGREVADRRVLAAVLWGSIPLGIFIAAYGLAQTNIGFFPWDKAWLDIAGYASLSVYGLTRGFGTFASSAEYALFLGVAVVAAVAALLHGRILAALPLPLLGAAIFFESSRGIVVFVLLAIVAMVGLRTRRVVIAIALWVVIGGAVLGGWAAFGGAAETAAIQSGDPFAVHQVSGLADPLNPDTSTLVDHWQAMVSGTSYALANPLGAGTSGGNLASTKLGGVGVSTELDFIDELIDLGIIGGVLYLAVIIAVAAGTFRAYLQTHDVLLLCTSGILIVTLGHWLSGGYYAVAPLVWFVAGWAHQQSVARAVVEPQRTLEMRRIRAEFELFLQS
jgi:hypothetical protein